MRVPYAVAAVAAVALTAALPACNPYQRHSGEYYAGAVDPSAFPASYARSQILASAATAHDTPAPYYAFAVSAAQAASPDPLAVAYADDTVHPTPTSPAPAIPAPLGYAFDPRCVPPPGYVYNPEQDGYRLDVQGSVFTALPAAAPAAAANYAPIVAEVPVISNGEPCQSIKSEAAAITADDVIVGAASNRFLAWAIVNPGAEVRFPDGSLDPTSGLGPQRLGWFEHYLVAYLDGGELPVASAHAIPQNLYVPATIPRTLPSGVVVPAPGALGGGYDLLDAVRGEPGYSPLCRVLSFEPVDPLHPPTRAADIDAATLHDTGTLVWCLQVAP